jgi:high affinity Mn2+ porin
MQKIISTLALFILAGFANAQTLNDSSSKWTYHFQLTAINQGHLSFKAKYSGENSLINSAEHNYVSVTSTLFVGRKLWKNGAIYWNEEIAGGQGISSAKGIAGFTNGETFRIGSPAPALYLARLYFRQSIPLQNASYQKKEDDANQLEGYAPSSCINIIAGKFGMDDFFDLNKYSHDPRSEFMNWSLMSTGAWDYPANTRGYTTGFVVELVKPSWAARISGVVEPKKANGLVMDYNIIQSHGLTFEIEKSWKLNRPGTVRFLAFYNASQAPTYNTTLQEVKMGDSTSVPVYTGEKEWKIYGGKKYGFGVNAEQEITRDAGIFFKASWNDGKTATWAFTEIDRSVSAGINSTGRTWKRKDDVIGVAEVINGISKDHRNFLHAGLYGFIIGDGNLNYGAEAITEIYYEAKLTNTFFISADYQFVQNPAYNKDRGPVHVYAVRVHIEF